MKNSIRKIFSCLYKNFIIVAKVNLKWMKKFKVKNDKFGIIFQRPRTYALARTLDKSARLTETTFFVVVPNEAVCWVTI